MPFVYWEIEQVKRNIARFPEDFMFQLNRDEVEMVKSQFATSRKNTLFIGHAAKPRVFKVSFPFGILLTFGKENEFPLLSLNRKILFPQKEMEQELDSNPHPERSEGSH